MSVAAGEVRVPCGAKYPEAGAAHVVRPDACGTACAPTRFWGRRFPLSAPAASKRGADINFSSPGGAWRDERPVVDQRGDGTRPRDRGPRLHIASCGEAGGRESFLQTATLLGGTERLAVGTGISSARGGLAKVRPGGCACRPGIRRCRPRARTTHRAGNEAECRPMTHVHTRPPAPGPLAVAHAGPRQRSRLGHWESSALFRHVWLPFLKRDIVVAQRRRSRSSHARA